MAKPEIIQAAIEAVQANNQGGDTQAAPPEPKTDPTRDAAPGPEQTDAPEPPAGDAQPEPEKTEPRPEPEPEAKAKPESERDKWSRKMKESAEKWRREQAIKRGESQLKEADDAMQLLRSDPVAFAQRYGGETFGRDYVRATLADAGADGKTEPKTPAEVAELRQMVQQLQGQMQAKEIERHVSEYRSGVKSAIGSIEGLGALRSFHSDEELESIVMSQAEHMALSTNQVLQASEYLPILHDELRERLERMAQSEAGKQLLRDVLGETNATPASQKTGKERTPSAVLTNNMDSAPPSGGPKSREKLIEWGVAAMRGQRS